MLNISTLAKRKGKNYSPHYNKLPLNFLDFSVVQELQTTDKATDSREPLKNPHVYSL